MKCVVLLTILVRLGWGFNLDAHAPVYKYGPEGSYFGYSIAEHFKKGTPVVLIGAPRGENGQRGTEKAGALFSCPINTQYSSRGGSTWCEQARPEYTNAELYNRTPDMATESREIHYLGKNSQLLGASLSSQGTPGGAAVVCAPLMRFHNTSAYLHGACYELDTQLHLTAMHATCAQKNLLIASRQNSYGSCMEGVASKMSDNMLLTGAIGAMMWTGGVYAKMQQGTDIFASVEERYTMANTQRDGASNVRPTLASHDYLGYSVNAGRFGFAHEKGARLTVVSGATRFKQHGAVVFMPFINDSSSSELLGLTSDRFVLNGTRMGGAFGYAVEVLDLNNDGFDDLLVSAPFEHRNDVEGHFGGVVYVYFSQGKQRGDRESHLVFHKPIVLKAGGPFSQFGLSITKLGNVDGDAAGCNDFAIGAPFEKDGTGAVYIYHGNKDMSKFRKKPVQVIRGNELPGVSGRPVRSFGFSLSGGSDLDGNGYPDLAVGAVSRDLVAVFRARPVISLSVEHKTSSPLVEIEKGQGCPRGSKTCFDMDLSLRVDAERSKSAQLVNFNDDVFVCNLEVVPVSPGVERRAHIAASHSTNHSWPCGRNAHNEKLTFTHKLYIPDSHTADWVNPLKVLFTVRIANERHPKLPGEGERSVDINNFPILHKFTSSYEFTMPFNTRCGEDQVCESDLSLKAAFTDIPKTEEGMYVSNVGDKDHMDLQLTVDNRGEKAYGAGMYLTFDPEELELPQLVGKSRVSVQVVGKEKNIVHVQLGNPMEQNSKQQLSIRFKIVRGRTEGIGRPLQFNAVVNSTSNELKPEDNEWQAQVRLIKKAELELIGVSEPAVVRFGGEIRGESGIELEEDIGPMFRHNYTIHNKGPWTVRNVVAKFDWPYQVESVHSRGKWALYLLDLPTITTLNTDGTVDVRECHVEHKWEHVNPVEHIKLNTKYSQQLTAVSKKMRLKRDAEEAAVSSAGLGFGRISPIKREENGQQIDVVTIGCAERTAKCFTVVCHFDFIDANSAPVVDFRARLWNSTFIEDYSDVEYVELASFGRLELDSSQGIDDDPSNNAVAASTQAYPDKPAIDPSWQWPEWYLLLAAALTGLLILLLIVLLLWKCGFFKRKDYSTTLHRAELRYEREMWEEQ